MLGVNGVVSESCVQLVLRCFISRDDESLETIATKADGSALKLCMLAHFLQKKEVSSPQLLQKTFPGTSYCH